MTILPALLTIVPLAFAALSNAQWDLTTHGVRLLQSDAASHTAKSPGTDWVAVPEPSAQAISYHRTGDILWLVYMAWGLAVPALLLFTGCSARIRGVAQRIGRNWFFTIELYLVSFFVLWYALRLPLDFYAGYLRQHAYDLSNQTLGKWFYDWALSRSLVVLVACLVVWLPYLLLRKSPKRWWLYTGAAILPILFAGMLILPIWIAPLFNDFGPMKDKGLEAKVLALASRAGIDGGRVYEENKSVDTKEENAYVAGLGDTKRIVLWDTLLAKAPEREILFTVGHEMGHYVLGHVVQGMLVAWLLVLIGLFAIARSAEFMVRRFGERFGFAQLSDVASFPLLLLLANFFALFIVPVGLAYSRHIEHEADRFGLEITRDNHAAAMSFVRVANDNLGMPRHSWFYTVWRGSHPSIAERIEFCNQYRPWETDQPLKYENLFRRSVSR
jgi:Zn-dependent protease with chaperone function